MLRSFSPIGRKAYSALVKSAAATGKDSFSSSWMALSGVSRSISVWSKARPPALHVRRSSLPLSVHLAGSSSHFSSSRGRPPSNPNRLAQSLGALGTGVVVLFGKGKYLIGALKLTKLASLGSMLVTVGTYSVFFGWPYAVGMVGLILVHETGHMMVMLQRGIPFSPAVFVPFMGAAIVMKRRPGDAWEDALVAFGGPVVGSLGAVACTLGGHATDSQLLFALADFGYMINLFNLMPIGSMDGGRIGGALSKYAGVVGLGIGGSMIYAGTFEI
jgi:Zn-dependent protease